MCRYGCGWMERRRCDTVIFSKVLEGRFLGI